MTAPPALEYEWTGEGFTPTQRHRKTADGYFVVGQRYALTEVHERSSRSHAHFFASMKEAYDNLPENIASQFKNAEHFRARGLIECGFCDEHSFVCASPADAIKAVSLVTKGQPYAAVSIVDNAAVVRIAHSQSYKAMNKAEFENTHQQVLEWAWHLVGLKPGRAA
jgi:predicted nucleotidyltransferase